MWAAHGFERREMACRTRADERHAWPGHRWIGSRDEPKAVEGHERNGTFAYQNDTGDGTVVAILSQRVGTDRINGG